jgi:two-component sensor histidine kinase
MSPGTWSLTDLFSSDGFMPHGHCYLWNPGLVWLHVVSDGVIALAYMSIPFTFVYLARKRRDIPFNWMFFSFGTFIVACGATHAMEVWTLWTPWYWLSGAIKAVTAIASVTTAIFLIRILPRALAIPRSSDLFEAHEKLRLANGVLENRTSELSTTLRERETLLREKTSLLQEVHHRVKNNLQMISSLLNLQARQIVDKEMRAIFLESQGRVRSIALLHESLYQFGDLGRIDMQEYVKKLVATLGRSYGSDASSARIVAEIGPVYLTANEAVPIGLIVNELVTNSLKHAFVGKRDDPDREIRIEMRVEDDQLTLRVADNGRGFGSAVAPMREETMGLTLVRDLSLQLRGNAEFATANGAVCTVRFPLPRELPRRMPFGVDGFDGSDPARRAVAPSAAP